MNNNDERFISQMDNTKLITKNGKLSGEQMKKFLEIRELNQLKSAIEKYMPIGSVVELYDSNTQFMIIGFNYFSNNTQYDYIACKYPNGIGQQESTYAFNHEQIKSVCYVGYVNLREEAFKEELISKTR